jgi:hypothetical protein
MTMKRLLARIKKMNMELQYPRLNQKLSKELYGMEILPG